jgi:hypothetical protein
MNAFIDSLPIWLSAVAYAILVLGVVFVVGFIVDYTVHTRPSRSGVHPIYLADCDRRQQRLALAPIPQTTACVLGRSHASVSGVWPRSGPASLTVEVHYRHGSIRV